MKITKETLNNTVLILAIITIATSFLGYIVQVGVGIPEAFYGAYSFIVGDGKAVDIEGSILLQTAAFTAPFSIALLIIFFFFQEVNKWFFLSFRAKDHCIIFGLGHMGIALAEDILEHHKKTYRKLIIIEPDDNNPNIEFIRLRGVIVLHEDATNPKLLQKIKANRAKSLITLTGSDVSNMEIAIGLAKMKASEPKLYVHLEHRENEVLLQSGLFADLNIKGFNVYDHAAQTLFMRHPIGSNAQTVPGNEAVRIAIIGVDTVGISVLYRVLNLGHFYNGKPIEVTLYDEEISSKQQQFLKTFPIAPDCPYWKVAFEDEAQFYAKKIIPFNQIIFCKRSTQKNFADAMRLVRNRASSLEGSEVFVYAGTHEKIAGLVDAEKSGALKNLYIFGVFRQICSHDVIINETLDAMAKLTNARYNDLHGYNEKQLSSEDQWKRLDPFLKESNRMQAEHLLIKLKVINSFLGNPQNREDYEAVKKEAQTRWFVHGGEMLWDEIRGAEILASHVPIDVLDGLARMEKMRWNAFHILNGWKKLDISAGHRGKVAKDKELKLHPCIVPWDELDKVSINHQHDYKSDDVETVMRAYEMLDGASFQSDTVSSEFAQFKEHMAMLSKV